MQFYFRKGDEVSLECLKEIKSGNNVLGVPSEWRSPQTTLKT